MFTYQFGANPTIDFPRMLIGDTVCDGHIFEDSEIQAFYTIQQQVWQSGMFYSGNAGVYLPSPPVSYLRVAAMMAESIASVRARLISITKLLDVQLSSEATQKASAELRALAKQWREVDDDSGAMVIIEQCTTQFGFIQRFWQQVQRQIAST